MPDRNDATLPTEASDSPGTSGESASGESASGAEEPPAVDDLRAQVHRAADEIGRLRREVRRLEAENDEYRQRVEALEADPAAGRDETALLVDDDPDALREQIDRFIEAIDAHVAGGSA